MLTYHKIHEGDSDKGKLGVGENQENSNGMNEWVVVTNFADLGITTETKAGCAQNAAPVTRVVREVAATPIHKQEHRQEEGKKTPPPEERKTPPPDKKTPPPSDEKDEHADDPQEREQDKNQESPQSKVGSEMTHDKQQHDKDGAPIVDNKGNMNGTQGDTSEDRPANKNNTEAGNGGSGSGEHITDAGSGNQGGSGEGSTGSNEADSGGSGKETSQDSQGGSSDNNNAASGGIELQSVPIMEED